MKTPHCVIGYEKYRLGHGDWTMTRVYGPFEDEDHAKLVLTTKLNGVMNDREGKKYYDSNSGGDSYLMYEIHPLDNQHTNVGLVDRISAEIAAKRIHGCGQGF